MKNTQYKIQGNGNTTILMNYYKKHPEESKVLTYKQERELIEKFKDNREELNKQLTSHNITAVFGLAAKYALKSPSYDDMVMDAIAQLQVAAERFNIYQPKLVNDPNTNKKVPLYDKHGNPVYLRFLTYATSYIKKGLTKEFTSKNHSVEQNSISMSENSPLMDSSNEKVTVLDSIDTLADPTYEISSNQTLDDISSSFKREAINEAFKCIQQENAELTATDIKIYKENVMMGESKKNICEKYNVTPQYVTKLQNNISHLLKKVLTTKFKIASSTDFDFA